MGASQLNRYMKRFKKFLIEETMASAETAGDTQPVTAPSIKVPVHTPTTKPSTIKRKEGDEEEDDSQETAPPTFDEWIEQNPIPRREDYESQEDYDFALERWRIAYLEWLRDYRSWHQDQNPLPDNTPPGEWNVQLDDRMRELNDIARETYGAPIDPDRDRTPDGLPPGWTKDDYYYWKKEYERFFGRPLNGNESQFYDWLWRLFRQNQGTPGDVPPVHGTNPDYGPNPAGLEPGAPWVEPPFSGA